MRLQDPMHQLTETTVILDHPIQHQEVMIILDPTAQALIATLDLIILVAAEDQLAAAEAAEGNLIFLFYSIISIEDK